MAKKSIWLLLVLLTLLVLFFLLLTTNKKVPEIAVTSITGEAIKLYQDKGYKRFYVTKRGGDYINDKDMVLKLADAEICISNQWDLDGVENFIEHMKKIGTRIE